MKKTIGTKEAILKEISSDKKLMLRPCDGSRTICSSKNVFFFVDTAFKSYGADKKGVATKETQVAVYEMEKDATFAEMFGWLNSNIDALCMTQDQILEFIEMHRCLLRTDGPGTFFLFKNKKKFFIACVRFHDDGLLKVFIVHFKFKRVWNADDRRRVVVPKLVV